MKKIISLALLALCLNTFAQRAPSPVKAKDYQFTTVKENPVTSVKNQYRSGTCWCFSTLSFLESEIIKAKNLKDASLYPDFSEMFVVRKAYYDRSIKYVRMDGKLNFAAGSDFGDVLEVAKTYGLANQSAALKGYVDAIIKNPNKKLTKVWPKGVEGILDAYMGEIPEDKIIKADALGINLDDYLGFTSYTHHPFYTAFAMEVEDNWRCTPSWNVPLDEFMAIIDNAVDKGYTVAWGGDVSEPGFTRDGLAILIDMEALSTSGSDQERWVGKAEEKPAEKLAVKEIEVTQELRQDYYDEKTSTDDHGMHIYGTAKDQNGTKYYIVKNSWGETGEYKGIWYMSENYLKGKTLNILVNKNAVPKDILKKIGLK